MRLLCNTIINLMEHGKNITSHLSAPFSSVMMFRTEGHTGGCLCCWIKRLVSLQPGCLPFSLPPASPRAPRTLLWIPQIVMALVHGRAGVCYNFVFWTSAFFGTEQHFPEVMLGEEFLSLSLDQVCSLISSDKLTVSSEEKVWHGPSLKQEPLSWGGHGKDLWFNETFSLFQIKKKILFFCPFFFLKKKKRLSGPRLLHSLYGLFKEGVMVMMMMMMAAKLPPFFFFFCLPFLSVYSLPSPVLSAWCSSVHSAFTSACEVKQASLLSSHYRRGNRLRGFN